MMPSSHPPLWLGVDTGGTFTDFVLFDGQALRIHKVLTTPHAPEQAILEGMRELGLGGGELRMVHGSTVATNAVLERKGVRTVYIANRGLRDVLTIGRQARSELYNLQPAPVPPPVSRELCLETGGRLAADGQVLEPLTDDDLAALRRELARLAPRSVAINLLFAYLDDGFERAIEAVVPDGVFVSRSSAVLAEIKEYERGIATWLNAWVGPLVADYLGRLEAALPGARVAVMQSSGETIAADQAGGQAVRMLLSGPAGGLIGARFVGGAAGRKRLLSFDMGGTSTDVALIEGEPRLTSEGRIGPYPVAVPMVDMHTIGAGGGSIACLDEGGMLQVGPESAGATPGPACYGQGGVEPTVTDANLVLGRLRADLFLGGAMRLDEDAARLALGPLAAAMGVSAEAAALGVIRVANEHMAQALRVISVQKGVDPRDFTLVSFGGAGGLHVCALAEALGMRRAMVPVHAGVLSALGMIAARPGRQLSRTMLGPLDGFPENEVQAGLQQVAAEGVSALQDEGLAADAISESFSLDLRYQGQAYTLNLPWTGVRSSAAAFHQLHEERYGHRLDLPVELVNLRVGLHGQGLRPELGRIGGGAGVAEPELVTVHGVAGKAAIFARADLSGEASLQGPAVITETVATTWLAPGWRCELDPVGSLLLDRESVAPTGGMS